MHIREKIGNQKKITYDEKKSPPQAHRRDKYITHISKKNIPSHTLFFHLHLIREIDKIYAPRSKER